MPPVQWHWDETKISNPYIISEADGWISICLFISQKELIIESVQQAAQVIALSRFQKAEIEKFTGRKAEIIPNVVEVKNEKPFQQQAKLWMKKFQFILVGILSR